MRTTIFVALGRHSMFKASANAAVTYKSINKPKRLKHKTKYN
jgi:hypothetical protein